MNTDDLTLEELMELDEFTLGLRAAPSPNGKYYLCTEYYGQAISGVFGKVKQAGKKNRIINSFIDIILNVDLGDVEDYLAHPDRGIEYHNTRYLFNILDDNHKELGAVFYRNTVKCQGYKIKFSMFGYSIYDQWKGQRINDEESIDNSDFYTPEQVIEFLLDENPDTTMERLEKQESRNDRKRKTVFLATMSDYKEFMAGKREEGKAITVQYTPNAQSPTDKFMSDVDAFINAELEEKKLRIRFKKRTKHFDDAHRRLSKFLMLASKLSGSKITPKQFRSGILEIID